MDRTKLLGMLLQLLPNIISLVKSAEKNWSGFPKSGSEKANSVMNTLEAAVNIADIASGNTVQKTWNEIAPLAKMTNDLVAKTLYPSGSTENIDVSNLEKLDIDGTATEN